MFAFSSDASTTMRCMDRASLEQLLRQGLSLAEIGRRFDLHEATVSYWAQKHGLQAVHHAKHVAKGGLTRGEIEPQIDAGKSIAQIAGSVGRSKATVRHWLREYGLKTRRAAQSSVAPRSKVLSSSAMWWSGSASIKV